jgi:transposase
MAKTNIAAAGIDTAKDKLDVVVHGQTKVWQVRNVAAGWRQMSGTLEEHGVTRIGIEASGGYETGVVRHLRAKGFTVLVLQPAQVRAWAKAHRIRAKNDRLDAMLIARCTAEADEPRGAPDERLEELAADLTLLDQIGEDIARWKTRLEHAGERQQPFVQSQIKSLKKQQKAQMASIGQALCRHPDLAERLKLVLSVPGIGERTAITIVIRMPEIGRLSREEIASLAGLAPFDNDSGKRKGERHVAGGRSRLRRALYTAAWPASNRWNPALVALYRRLRAAGKQHKVALVACARKLLIYANTVVQRGTPWVAHERSVCADQKLPAAAAA